MRKWRKLRERIRLRQARYELDQLVKEKRSEEMEALEEVFDKRTLFTIYRMLNRGDLKRIHGVVKAGKEARIYWGKGSEGDDIAVKIYLTASAEFRKGRLPYIEGDPRFKRVRRDTRSLVDLWAQKEFKNLEQSYNAGVRVPKPFRVEGNVLLMEFIGRDGSPAPLLRETVIAKPGAMYRKLLRDLRLLYRKAELVHGDLSEYNVMIWNGQPVIFDMAQAVPLEHPLALDLLRRDIANLNSYFSKLDLQTRSSEEIFSWVTNGAGI